MTEIMNNLNGHVQLEVETVITTSIKPHNLAKDKEVEVKVEEKIIIIIQMYHHILIPMLQIVQIELTVRMKKEISLRVNNQIVIKKIR